LITAVYVGITLALAQGCGQCLNQYADAELDKMIKRYRPIPSGLVSREEALGLSWLLAIFAIGRAFTTSLFFGLITLTLIFFAVFYSLAPFSPRKIHPLANVLWMAIARGFIPMFAVWSIFGNLSKACQYSILAFIWVFGLQSSKDISDSKGDRMFKIKTVPNTYGLRGLITLITTCTILYVISTLLFQLYLMILIVPLALIAALTTQKQTTMIENNISWAIFYAGLATQYLLMFINERFIL